MTIEEVVRLATQALYIIIKLSAPALIVSLVIGLIVSIFQTVTSIQEQTLTFVPKIIGVFLTIILTGYWVMSTIKDYIINLWADFGQYIR